MTCFKKLSPTHTHPLKPIHEFLKPYKLLFFWVRVTCKMLNVTCIKIHSIILSVNCHGLRNFPLLIHIPSYTFVKFKTLWVIIFWVRVTHKMLNLNWEKIHSIILSVTCHGLRNFPLLIHIPLYPFVNCWNPMSYYFLSLSFDPPHPTPTWPTNTWYTPPYPTPSWPTPPLHDTHHPPHPTPSWPTHPTPPHPWYIFGHKGAFFHGLLRYVSLR